MCIKVEDRSNIFEVAHVEHCDIVTVLGRVEEGGGGLGNNVCDGNVVMFWQDVWRGTVENKRYAWLLALMERPKELCMVMGM